jgi:D-alanyl-D-alanine carboxypeptidase (penicillin-binding protein 5/6)
MSRERRQRTSRRPVLTGGRRRTRRWPRVIVGGLLLAALVVLGLALVDPSDLRQSGEDRRAGPEAGGPEDGEAGRSPSAPPAEGPSETGDAAARAGGGDGSRFALDLSRADVVKLRFVRKPRGGLLFDVRSGRVLWRRNPGRRLAIASLTKMMTALLVAEREGPHERVRVSRRAVKTPGSAVGLLPRGKRVQLEAMLNGLLLVSGNDAAVALAEHTAGDVRSFVRLMNRRADDLGLSCTTFSSPHGLLDRGNRSCAIDLAVLARADLAQRRIRRIARKDRAILKFPIKGGRLFLYNNNPLIRSGYRGTTGLKTGYTERAGRSIVATAKRGRAELGVVLLHSYNPAEQARKLLDRGFAALRSGSG